MRIKYSMEGFIIYLKINTVGNTKRGFTDHNASRRSLILRSVITIADDNMQDQHCSCIAGIPRSLQSPDQMVDQHLETTATALNVSGDQDT